MDRLKKISVLTPQPEVQIRGDGGAKYDSVGRIIYAAQRAGIAKVGFITEPPRARRRLTAHGRRERERSMGMNIGSGSGSKDPDVILDVNTTPLIDVMLVLLVMLIITIPIQLHSTTLNMPTGNPPPPLVKPEVVKLDIDASSVIYWNAEVRARTVRRSRKSSTTVTAYAPQPEIHLRPDRNAKYEVVAMVMASAQRLGATKIGIVGSEQFIND